MANKKGKKRKAAMEPTNSGAEPSSSRCVQVTSNTWTRDSHDLFDFEARHLFTKEFTAEHSVTFARSGTDVQMMSSPLEASLPPEPLLRLVQKDRTFWIDKAAPGGNAKRLWQVVRDMNNSSHSLSESDLMKLGRFKFRVRQMVASADAATQPELRLEDHQSAPASCRTDDPEDADARRTACCRICLLDGSDDPSDPLIRPCQCKGSIAFVHLGCLRQWIKGRLSLPDTQNGSYFYKQLGCELCRSPYPTYVDRETSEGSSRETLVEVPRTAPPFIVLENMARDSQQHSCRGLHVISLAEGKLLKLGRGHESDIRIADVSISRCHATVRFHQGQFILEDHNSKFGTLVALRKPLALNQGGSTSIQVGRSVLKLSLQDRNAGQAGDEMEQSL